MKPVNLEVALQRVKFYEERRKYYEWLLNSPFAHVFVSTYELRREFMMWLGLGMFETPKNQLLLSA